MAEQGYGCIFGDCKEQVSRIITYLDTGASVSVCGEHFAPAMIPIVASELGVDPGEFYAMIERYLDREAKKAAKALADAQAAKAAKGSQGPAAPADPPPGGDETPTFVITGVDPDQGIVGQVTT